MTGRHYWIGVVSRAHVQIGVQGGFMQLNHGKRAPVQRLRGGDALVVYSPRVDYPDGEPLQCFTAIGVIATGDVYQVEMTPEFNPYRVDVRFLDCQEAPIKMLIGKLTFIKNKTNWGAAFRFGQLKIPELDFLLIADAMGCAAEFAG
ncbi:MAG: EVE domain-containing protein [Tahibacter sp.]